MRFFPRLEPLETRLNLDHMYWAPVGGSQDWASAGNWWDMDAGLQGVKTPDSSDDVLFTTANGDCSTPAQDAASCASLDLTGYSGTLSLNGDLIVQHGGKTGDSSIRSGTIVAGAPGVHLVFSGGTPVLDGGSLNPGNAPTLFVNVVDGAYLTVTGDFSSLGAVLAPGYTPGGDPSCGAITIRDLNQAIHSHNQAGVAVGAMGTLRLFMASDIVSDDGTGALENSGTVVTNADTAATVMWQLRNHGTFQVGDSSLIGFANPDSSNPYDIVQDGGFTTLGDGAAVRCNGGGVFSITGGTLLVVGGSASIAGTLDVDGGTVDLVTGNNGYATLSVSNAFIMENFSTLYVKLDGTNAGQCSSVSASTVSIDGLCTIHQSTIGDVAAGPHQYVFLASRSGVSEGSFGNVQQDGYDWVYSAPDGVNYMFTNLA
jgi:hypothetical protein